MAQKEDKKIKLANKNSVRFPIPEKYGNILLIGNFDSVCGTLQISENGKKYFFTEFSEAFKHNVPILTKILQSGKHIYLISTKETDLYFRRLLTCLKDMGAFDKVGRNKVIKQYHWQELDCERTDSEMTDCLNNKLYNGLNEMKFDIVIQNPPYNGSLHLDFLEKGLDVLTETGKMVIIEPATWLINVRKNGKAKRYDTIKQRINGHIESVVIENLNKEFSTANDTPFAITTIDMSKTFDTIDYTCCGEHKVVKSVYDCNLVGNYNTIWSIFEKVQSFGDMMSNHIFNPKNDIQYEAYLRYWKYQLYALGSNYGNVVNQYNDKTIAVYRNLPIGEYFSSYVDSLFYGEVSGNKPLSRKGNLCDCLCGNKTELENWTYNVSNNKLFLFLTICTIFDKHNDATNLYPFLSDKKYTDDEITELFNFTNDEIYFINKTLKKFHYNSPWFKRYMCGKDAVSDEEVNNFIAEISK